MKIVSLLVSKVLAVIAVNTSFVWVIVEFILYLVKDKIFNWSSVWIFILSALTTLGLGLIAFVWKLKDSKKMNVNQDSKPKSRFKQRLDEMERNNKRK